MLEFKVGDASRPQQRADMHYDVIIIGAGPAGFATALYTARDGIKTLVLEREAAGGLAATTEAVENYPGFPKGISGTELMERFQAQAERFGAEVVEFEEVTQIEPVDAGLFRVHTDMDHIYEAKVVVIATGSRPRHLEIPGEEEFYGQGVSYCATCDGPFFKGKDVVVVGCGNSGLQEGGVLLNYARRVAFVVSHPEPPAEKVLQTRVKAHDNSVCYLNYRVVEIRGDTEVRNVVLQHVETGELTEIPTDGVFIYAGYLPDTAFVEGLVSMDADGYIETDDHMRTNVKGILAVGDVRAGNLAQITVAVGDGTKAAITAREYLAALGNVKKGDVVGYEAKYH